MAEAFAVVASSVGIASFALQLLDSVVKLRRLWTDVKDAPTEVIDLVSEIEVLGLVLGTIKPIHSPTPGNATFDAVFNQCYSLCEQGARNLEHIARDLEMLIKRKQTMGALRIVLKKVIVADHRSRLERAKTSLLLAQQTYLTMQQAYHTSLHIQHLQKADAILVTQEQLLSQSLQLVSQPHTPGCNQFSSTQEPLDSNDIMTDVTIPADQTILIKRRAPGLRKREKDRLSFRTPTWLMSRVWEIRVREACSGWTIDLSSYHIRPEEALVFDYTKGGDIQNLQRLFDSGDASPFDRYPDGRTLLHLAVSSNQPETCRFLLKQGVDSKTPDFYLWTPLRYHVALYPDRDESKLFEMSRLLITEADTDELIDIDSVVELLDNSISLMIPSRALRLLQEELWFPWASIDVRDRVTLAVSEDYDTDNVKLLLGSGPLLKEYFEVQPSGARENGLFAHIAEVKGKSRRSEHGDASWQAFLRDAIGVNAHLCTSGWGQSPLVTFLDYLRLNSTRIGLSEQPERYWLESLHCAGADLVEYGRLEKRILKGSNLWSGIRIWRRPRSESRRDIFRENFTRIHIINLSYGPEPEDWHVWFSWELDEWAGEFWHMVENPELFGVPGAWIADDCV